MEGRPAITSGFRKRGIVLWAFAHDASEHWFVLERDSASAIDSAQGTYDVFVDGILIHTQPYKF